MDTTEGMKRVKVRVGPQGRVVIPAAVRQALGVEVGEELIMRVEDGRMVFERREDVVRRLKERFAGVASGRSLSEELIAERREEAAREAARTEDSTESSVEVTQDDQGHAQREGQREGQREADDG